MRGYKFFFGFWLGLWMNYVKFLYLFFEIKRKKYKGYKIDSWGMSIEWISFV